MSMKDQMKSSYICVAVVSIILAGCTAPVTQQRCVVIPLGNVYPYDRPYTKYDKYGPDTVVCPTPKIPLAGTGTGPDVPPGPGPNPPPPPKPPAPTPQGSVAGGGVAAAVQGKESSYAGGGKAGADSGLGQIDVSALRPKQ
jgi:hypothetical protein